MITKTEIKQTQKGWCFLVFYDNKPYASFVSASFRTKKKIESELDRYIKTGEFEFYGDAE